MRHNHGKKKLPPESGGILRPPQANMLLDLVNVGSQRKRVILHLALFNSLLLKCNVSITVIKCEGNLHV